ARVRAVINVDMLGDKNLKVMIPANTHDGFRRGVLKLAAQKNVADRVVAIDDIVTDDHVPFMEAGFKAINLIDFEYGSKPGKNDYWHTPEDTLDKISIESLKFSGELLAWIIERLS
ncbi:MAG: M28 family peptidase, partial [Kiritimatiellae bacterium]|nr:M28 family peptidase [Kiritimatiellia bacterium]